MKSYCLFSFVTCDSLIFIYVAVAYSFSVWPSVWIPIVWIYHSLSILLLIDIWGYFSLRPLWKCCCEIFLITSEVEHIFICLLAILFYEFSVQHFCLYFCLVSCFFLFISRNSLFSPDTSPLLVKCWLYVFLSFLVSWYFYVVKFIYHFLYIFRFRVLFKKSFVTPAS